MIFIQQDTKGKPFNEDAEQLIKLFEDLKIQYQLLSFESIKFLNHSIKTHFFFGSIEFMKEVFFYQIYTMHPKTFTSNPYRKGEVLTVKDLITRISNGETWFVKPYGISNMKKFDGFVCNQYTLSFLNNYNDQVICYEPFSKNINSEWRAFIYNDEIVDIRNYSGKPTTFPNLEFIKKSIIILNESDEIKPKAYCIDVGIFDDGENTVIEYTDMWSLGGYGVDTRIFFRLLKSRYFDIIKKEKEA